MVFILSVVALLWLSSFSAMARNICGSTSSRIALLLGGGGILAAGAFGILALFQFFTQIPAGHVGVVDFFGVVSDKREFPHSKRRSPNTAD